MGRQRERAERECLLIYAYRKKERKREGKLSKRDRETERERKVFTCPPPGWCLRLAVEPILDLTPLRSGSGAAAARGAGERFLSEPGDLGVERITATFLISLPVEAGDLVPRALLAGDLGSPGLECPLTSGVLGESDGGQGARLHRHSVARAPHQHNVEIPTYCLFKSCQCLNIYDSELYNNIRPIKQSGLIIQLN